MKQFLLTWLLAAASLGSMAQRMGGANAVSGGGGGGTPPPTYEPAITGFADAINDVFQYVDKSRVPSGILEEYSFRFAPLRLFAGTLQDSNRTTATVWRLLYGSVLSGNINGSCPLPLLPDLNAALQTQVGAGPAIPLLVQRLDYATLRPDAVSAGLLTGQNEQLFDVPAGLCYVHLLQGGRVVKREQLRLEK